MMNEQEREAIMRLTMCARRNCNICKYGHHRKRVTVKLPQSCMDRITKNMNILADSLDNDVYMEVNLPQITAEQFEKKLQGKTFPFTPGKTML